MTQLASVLPITLTDVLAISISSSIPRIAMIGHAGIPKDAAVAVRITNDALGTAATPLLVSINVMQIMICSPILKCIPAAWATKIEARDKYNVVPSRLTV